MNSNVIPMLWRINLSLVFTRCAQKRTKKPKKREKKSVHTQNPSHSTAGANFIYCLICFLSECAKSFENISICLLVGAKHKCPFCLQLDVDLLNIVIRLNYYFQPEPHFKNRCSHCISYIYIICVHVSRAAHRPRYLLLYVFSFAQKHLFSPLNERMRQNPFCFHQNKSHG